MDETIKRYENEITHEPVPKREVLEQALRSSYVSYTLSANGIINGGTNARWFSETFSVS
jgi:hypothetical protein